MVKKEAGAIFVALLFVATMGAGVASAKGVTIGGGYDGSTDDVFTTDLWNGSFWGHVAEKEEVEAVKDMREARAEREAKAEGNYTFDGSRDRPFWPDAYWDIDRRYGRAFTWPGTESSWDVTYGFQWP